MSAANSVIMACRPRVLEAFLVDVREVLQRLEPIEDQKSAVLPNQAGEHTPALYRIADRLLAEVVAEESEHLGNEAVGVRSRVVAGALTVGAPAVDPYCAWVSIVGQVVKKAADERRLARSADGVHHDDVGFGGALRHNFAGAGAVPGFVEDRQLGITAEQARRSGGQTRDRDAVGFGGDKAITKKQRHFERQ